MKSSKEKPGFLKTEKGSVKTSAFAPVRLSFPLLTVFLLIVLLVMVHDLSASPESQESASDNSDNKKIVLQGVKPVKILTEDDEGLPIKFPSTVYYDKSNEELFMISANGRIVVYGADYYPESSLGKGRGINSIVGVFSAPNGDLYVCQSSNGASEPIITVLNAAFFKKTEISFRGIEEADKFSPRRIATGRDGIMYITSMYFKGVLVLDSEGNYLHKLSPTDVSFTSEEKMEPGSEKNPDGKQVNPAQEEKKVIPDDVSNEGKTGRKLEPVAIEDVATDNAGNIYLLSEQTSKVYVYSPNEEFLFSFGTKGGTEGKMSRPKSLALDDERRIVYICDYMRHTILIFDFDGNYVSEFGGKGWSPGWFQHPTCIATDKRGQLIVADLFNHRVQVLKIRLTTVSDETTTKGAGHKTFVKLFNELSDNLSPGSSPADESKTVKKAYLNPESEPCLPCHSGQKNEFEAYPSKHSDQSCIFCHPVHKEIPKCSKCHEPHAIEQMASDCVQCHPAHRPMEIASNPSSPRTLCTPCHSEIGELMDRTTTKHQAFTCAFCHKGTHPSKPSCKECHGKPHSADTHTRMPDCLDCHLDNHNLVR